MRHRPDPAGPPEPSRGRAATRNQRVAAWLTRRLGTMAACYLAATVMAGWMALAAVGVLGFDPYPFSFLLFLSSLAQLLFMFVIMVGQDVLGREGEQRAWATHEHTAVVLAQCEHLEQHMHAQERALRAILAERAASADDDQPHPPPPPARTPAPRSAGHRAAASATRTTTAWGAAGRAGDLTDPDAPTSRGAGQQGR